jgi:hypothetical protein
MANTNAESRRTFLRALFGTAAGGAVMVGASACQLAVGGEQLDGATYRVGELAPTEVVPVRPGVRYAGEMPSRVPMVRTLESAGAIY